MKKTQLILSVLLSVLLFNTNTSRAEDTDIYSGLTGNANIPNVMLIIDTAANSNANMTACLYWDGASPPSSKSLDNYMCALDTIVHGMSVNPDGSAFVKIGISTQSGIYFTLTPVDDNPYTGTFPGTSGLTNRQAMSVAIRAMTDVPGNAGQGRSFQETWAYYTGGNGGTTNVGENSGTVYTGSKVAAGCQKNYNIFISGVTASAHSSTQSSLTNLTNAVNNAYGSGTETATALLTPVTAGLGSEKGFGIEWARFMNSGDFNSTGTGTQNIITYSIAAGAPVYPAAMDTWETYIYDTALYGGGKYFAATSYAEIQNNILKILNEVQAVNSVFASSSLPVSVNAQGTYLNQIYMGMFRPDANGLPRWLGNLKQYQFGYDELTKSLSLVDSTGQAAISSAGTGFISPNAISFWTKKDTAVEPDLTGGFWRNHSQGAGLTYDLPDGELVEKGGAAQIMRYSNLGIDYVTTPAGPRNLYTYFGSSNNLNDVSNVFATTNASISDTLLGTGPRIITSITSSPKLSADRAYPINGGGGSPYVTITAFSKSGSTVTATVSLVDIALLAVGDQIKIATGATKYDCTGNICTILTVNTTDGTFTYSKSGGSGSPTLPYVAYIFVKWFQMEVDAGHGLVSGQTVTINDCAIYPGANTNVGAVQVFTNKIFRVALIFGKSYISVDSTCTYTPNTATATTSTPHGLAQGAVVLIYGTGIAGYNGSQTVTVLNTTQFTYVYPSPAPLANFSGTASMTSGSTTRTQLINWVRGADNYGDEASVCPPGTAAGTGNCPNPLVTIRPSAHGDVLHSRPTVINYGTTGVVVYYGTNDGVLRAINGNQTAAIGSTPAGGELWGFVPPDFLGKFKRLHDNSPALQLPSTPWGIVPAPQRKDYFIDGASSVYQKLNADGSTSKAYLYFTMRRGGRFMYAVNVTDPANPVFLWRTYNSGDFTELGQTWSQPKVAFVKGYVDGGGVAKPVLIFGGGYGYPDDNEPPTNGVMGRAIFIVDAETGTLVWKATYGISSACSGTTTKAACTVAGMNYAIPSDITLIDRYGNDGYIDRLYVGDLGGNIWRVDLEPTAGITPDHWKVTHLASLGCSGGTCAAGSTPRKLFYPPDIVPTASFDAVLIGSGDREHPLYSNGAYSKTNRFYMIKDSNVGNDGSDLNFTQSDLLNITDTSNPEVTTLPYDGTLNGYYITLGTGEKVVNAPLTVAGYTYFGTNTPATPSANSCTTNLGTAKGYQISPLTGTSNYVVYDGGGLPPSPVAGSVIVNVNGEDKVLPFCIGCGGDPDTSCKSALCGAKPEIDVPTSRSRTYWYKESD